MNILAQKRLVFSDLYIIKKSKILSFYTFSKVFPLLFMIIFSSNFSNASIVLQQKPTTKTTPKPSSSTTKVDKDKLKARLNKNKKKAIVKKDTLQDIDPANTGTPLYQNNN